MDPVHTLKEALRARRQGREAEERSHLEALAAAAESAESLAARGYLGVLNADRDAALAAVADLLRTDPAHPYAAGLGMALTERWPPEARHCETHLCARAASFRDLCRTLPVEADIAVELGAAHGLGTRFLAAGCAHVYAVEKSEQMAEVCADATRDLANVTVLAVDADSPGAVLAHAPRADLIFLDIGGSTPVKKVMHVARLYRELYQPRALAIRCVYLNNFVAGLASHEPSYGPTVWR